MQFDNVANSAITLSTHCATGLLAIIKAIIRGLVDASRGQEVDVPVTWHYDEEKTMRFSIQDMRADDEGDSTSVLGTQEALEAVINDVDLDPLQYPHVVVEALQEELERTRKQWRVDVQELESLFDASQLQKSETVWKEEVDEIKASLELMTCRCEAALQERDEAKLQSSRDIRELEEMITVLQDQNEKLANKLNSMPVDLIPQRHAGNDAIKHSDSEVSQHSSVNEPVEEPGVMSPSSTHCSIPPSTASIKEPQSPVLHFDIDRDPLQNSLFFGVDSQRPQSSVYFNIDREPGMMSSGMLEVPPPLPVTGSTTSLFNNL